MVRFQELEETLCKLPSIEAVRVIADRDRVTEVHVLAVPDRQAKQVVRDVQSLAMARFGLGIDRRAVSVVQIGPEHRGGEPDRPAIAAIQETPDGESTTTATVTLSWRRKNHVGTASGPAAVSARLRLIGDATLRALEDVLGGSPPMVLDAVAVAPVGNRPVMVAQVVSMRDGAEDVAVGSALVRGDEAEAVVRAVLDALNRRMPSLMR